MTNQREMNDVDARPGNDGNVTNVWLGARRSERVSQTLKVASLYDAETRLIHSYLGVDHFVAATREHSPLMSNLGLVALEGFLAERGCSVEGAATVTDYRRGDIGPPRMRIVELAPGRTGMVPDEGLLFLREPDGSRSILKVNPNGDTVEITLLTTAADVGAFFDDWKQYTASHAFLRGKQFYASGEFVTIDPPVRLSDIWMQPETRGVIQRMIVSFPRQVEHYHRHGLVAKRGVILEGPPGTGKTMICRALCCELDATVIWLTARHVQKEADVLADVWRLARMLSPTVILLEDLDLFAESRERAPWSILLGELMNQMDGVEDNSGILTVATTNRLDVVEEALRNRPGRFDRAIHLDEIDEAGRHQLLSKHLAHDRTEHGVLDRLTTATEGYTGARLVDLVKTLVHVATEEQADSEIEITMTAVDRALAELGPVRRRQPAGFAAEHEVAA